jgi:hypothetical protein
MIKQAIVKVGVTPGAASGGVSIGVDDLNEPIANTMEKRACETRTLPPVKSAPKPNKT